MTLNSMPASSIAVGDERGVLGATSDDPTSSLAVARRECQPRRSRAPRCTHCNPHADGTHTETHTLQRNHERTTDLQPKLRSLASLQQPPSSDTHRARAAWRHYHNRRRRGTTRARRSAPCSPRQAATLTVDDTNTPHSRTVAKSHSPNVERRHDRAPLQASRSFITSHTSRAVQRSASSDNRASSTKQH